MDFKVIVVSMVVDYYYLSSKWREKCCVGEFVSVPRIRFSVPRIRLLVLERLMSTSKKIHRPTTDRTDQIKQQP
jgi:hypothetical protein